MNIRMLSAFGLSFLFSACGDLPESEPQPTPDPGDVPSAAAPQPAAAADERVSIVFLGDSLTAGFGLDEAQAFPALVGRRLQAAGHAVRIVNAGISGDTTAGGLARLDWLLQQDPDILVVGLGGNDGLRGVPLASSEANLRAILEQARARDIHLLLAGMLIPPNYGADYTEQFAAIYPRLAAELDIPLIPFLLQGVAARPDLNLDDGIHPNAAGQQLVAATVFAALEPIVEEVAARETPSAEAPPGSDRPPPGA